MTTLSKIKLSIDDGCASDVRVASLAMKYGIETIFYWPVEWRSLAYDNGYEPLTFDQAKEIARMYEIGSHTITHRHLTKILPIEAITEIAESQQILKEMFNQDVEKFCPPRGYINLEQTLFASRLYKGIRLTKGEGLVHIHPNSGANNNKPWQECIDENTTELWGHSWEWDKFNMWAEVEECFAHLYR